MQSDTKFWCLNALFDLSIKFPDLFQETINLVIYRHFLGSSRSGHPVTSSYGLKLPRVHENLLGHLSRVYRVASVGSWSTVSRWVGYVVGSSFFRCCRLSKVGSLVAIWCWDELGIWRESGQETSSCFTDNCRLPWSSPNMLLMSSTGLRKSES